MATKPTRAVIENFIISQSAVRDNINMLLTAMRELDGKNNDLHSIATDKLKEALETLSSKVE